MERKAPCNNIKKKLSINYLRYEGSFGRKIKNIEQ